MSSPLRVALVGVGSHARRNVLPAFADAEGVELIGVYSRSEAARADASAAHGVHGYASEEKMLSDRGIDAIYVCTPVGTHGEWIHRALDAGKHVICEKTLVESPKQTEAVLAHGEQLGLAVFEAFMFEHHPQWAALQRVLAEGVVGDVRSLTARFGFPHLDPSNIRYRADLGGGALLDAGAYPIAAAVALWGEPDRVEGRLITESGYDVDTRGAAWLTWDDGRHAHLEWGFGHAYRNEVEVWGSGATVRMTRAFSKPSHLVTSVSITPQSGDASVVEVGPANHFSRMLAAFAAAIVADEVQPWHDAARARARVQQAIREND
jgi:predicted dehydrogenase